jgi:hypothetical protein
MNKALNELLSNVFAIQIAIWEFARSEKLIKRNGLGSKGNCLLLI